VKWDNRNDFNAVVSDQWTAIDLIRPFLTAMWSQKWIIFGCTLLMTVLGLLYVSQRMPSYTAHGLLIVENTRLEASRQEVLPEMSSVDASMIDSQVEIIRSDAIALKVIEALDLAADNERAGTAAGHWSTFTQNILTATGMRDSDAAHAPQTDNPLNHLPDFRGRLSVRRVGLSSVIDVGYKGSSPERSAQITNEIIRTYLADQTASAAAAAASASAWLRDRIKDLGPRTRIISAANPPIQKDGPRRLALLGVFSGTGLLIGFGAALLRYTFDTTMRDPSATKAKLGIPFLGAIAKLDHRSFSRFLKSRLAVSDPHPPVTDLVRSDFDALAMRIKLAVGSRGVDAVVGILSSTPTEGSTTVAASLALSVAAAGSRVLLVDGNVRDTGLSRLFAPGSSKGLADIAAGTSCLNEARLMMEETGIHFLPSGNGNVVSMGRNRTHALAMTQEWLEEYDLVLIDLPPLVSVPDLGFIRDMVSTFVLIVQWGQVPSALVEGALGSAGLAPKDLLGFVFNKVRRSLADRFTFPLESYRWKRARSRLRR
jgi:polysaccharide biosynthesis transport protein